MNAGKPDARIMRAKSNVYVRWLRYCALIWLAGCASPNPKALKSDYVKFADSYGDASNQQLLLNLARMANNQPLNFIQLGSFSSQYSFSAGTGITPSYTHNFAPGTFKSTESTGSTPPTGQDSTSWMSYVKNALTFGGSASANVTATPIFQFFPLTGSNLVGILMNPISDKVFYSFYDQGYAADLVARTMVEQVTFTTVKTSPAAIVITNIATTNIAIPYTVTSTNVLTNIAPTNIDIVVTNTMITNILITNSMILSTIFTNTVTTNYEYFVNNPRDPSYPDFLRFCEKLRSAQAYHTLAVGEKTNETSLIYSSRDTRLSDVVSAVQANLSAKYDTTNNIFTVRQPKQVYEFIPNTNLDFAYISNVTRLPNSSSKRDPTNAFNDALELARDSTNYSLKMRTVEAAMYTVAQEEPRFRSYLEIPNTNQTEELFDIKYFTTFRDVFKGRADFRNLLDSRDRNATFQSLLRSNDGTTVGSLVAAISTNLDATNINSEAFQTLQKTDTTNLEDLAQLAKRLGATNTAAAVGELSKMTNTANLERFLAISNDVIFCRDPNGPCAIVIRTNDYPFKVWPLMRITPHKGEDWPKHLVTSISFYNGESNRMYYAGDVDRETQNRAVFSILSYLFAQSAISTQNLPVQQLIQVQ